jgi:lipopolysaccharide/colanic/teichoic acid biosynthesis glycosyltransferase
MVAIVIATGQNAAFHGLDEYLPIPLLPLADRPFLQHVVEYLAHQGVRHFEFVLSHLPEKIESRFGDGARWGCTFGYHLAPSGDQSIRVAASIASGIEGDVILASGVSLPEFQVSLVKPDSLIFCDGVWTGWARFSPGSRMLLELASGIPEHAEVHKVLNCLNIGSGDEFLRAQREILDGTFPELMIAGREADPHIWIGRNVALHPSATILPPVYIGENCRIGKGAQIGPSAVIGANCIIDEHSIVLNSMVNPGTYIGEALELDSVIVDRNRLVNLRLGTSFLVSETFLLGSLTERSRGRAWQRLRDRLIALAFLLVLWPLLLGVYLFLRLSGTGRLVVDETIDIPADDNPAGWRPARILRFETSQAPARGQFLHSFLPGLVSALSGQVFLVGVRPRSRRQIEALPADWRSVYLKSKAGLITEDRVMFGPESTEDEIYTCEAFYSATESGWRDLRLGGLWLRGLFARSGQRKPPELAEDVKS